MTRISHLLLLLIITVAAAALTSARDCSFPAIFNFGDSNSDTGGFAAAFRPYTLPYGQTYFHHPAGRASNGRLLIDLIAERLRLPYLSGYLDAVGSNFTHGANFATGGSTIRTQNMTLYQSGVSPFSLNIQLLQFKEFITRSQQVRNQGGFFKLVLPDEICFSRGLYNFDIGINDLLAGFKLNLSTHEIKASVPDVLLQLSDRIKDVYAIGGRTFWIHNSGPIGCMPATLVRYPVPAQQIDEHGCSKPHNHVSQFFNLKLLQMVEELRTVLPLASITYVDVYAVKYHLISHAKDLGFEDPFLVCCGHGGRYNYDVSWQSRCGSAEVKPCEHPESRINWDGLHYTEAANKYIFDQLINDLC